MAKISELSQATGLSGSELLPVVVINNDETKENKSITASSLALAIKTLEELASIQFVEETVQNLFEEKNYITLADLAVELTKKAEILHEHPYSKENHTHNYQELLNVPDLGEYALATDFNNLANQFADVEANTYANTISIETILAFLETIELGGGSNSEGGSEIESGHSHSNFNVLETITLQKVVEWDSKSNFSGSYNDLTNKPNIPTKLSDLQNDIDLSGGGSGGMMVTPRTFGAKGDGVTDDTEAIQRCVDYCQENKLSMGLEGDYLVSNTISITKPLRVSAFGARFNLGGKEWMNPVIKIEGVLGTQYTLSSEVTIGASGLQFDSHDLQALDWVLLKSSKQALSSSEHQHFNLGTATASSAGAFFGEFAQISTVTKTYANLFTGIVFPSYDTKAVVAKVNFISNVIIDGLEFYNGTTYASGNLIKLQYARDCKIMNCIYRDGKYGNYINFINCLNCVGLNNVLEYSVKEYTNYYERNGYKMQSCQYCSFNNCTSYNGTQPFDITYKDGSIPSSFCEFLNCKSINSAYTCFTTHPATYRCNIVNCIGNGDGDGISIRGRGHLVSNNNLQGVTMTNYGICLAEGCGFETIVSNNNIRGYGEGLRINEVFSASRDCSYSLPLNSIFIGNNITTFNLGVRIDRAESSSKTNATLGVSFIGNVFKDFAGSSKYLVHVTGNKNLTTNGISFQNNFLDCTNSGLYSTGDVQSLIRLETNITNFKFTNNTVINLDSGAYIIYGTTTGRTVKAFINNNGLTNPLSTNGGVSSITVQTSTY